VCIRVFASVCVCRFDVVVSECLRMCVWGVAGRLSPFTPECVWEEWKS